MDRKGVAILALLGLLAVTGAGWLSSTLGSPRDKALPIPYDNTYNRAQIFHGYEAYLDRRISYMTVSGTSMAPTFKDNDVILWVEVDPAELGVGDIIVFDHPTGHIEYHYPIAHRITESRVRDGVYEFKTQGDAGPNPDLDRHWIPQEKVRGLVIGVIYSTPPAH